MSKVQLPRHIKNNTYYYGWVIVAISALGLFFSGPGQTYNVSIFIDAYIKSFGWSRSLISTFYSSATLMAGFTLPFVGRLIDKKGHRKMVIYASVILGFTCIWMSFTNKPIMILIGFFFLRLFGQGTMTLLSNTLTPQWFIVKRGWALSLMSLGGVLGSALIPIISNILIIKYNVAFAWMFWALLLVSIMAPLGWYFVRNKPEDVELLPDGAAKTNPEAKETSSSSIKEHSWTLKEAKSTLAFWLMLFCMVVPSMINTGITFHMVSLIDGKGYSSSVAAIILSITAFIQLPFTFLAGYTVDRYRVNVVKAINFCLLLVAILILAYGKSLQVLYLYSVLHGIFVAFDSVSTGVLWANYYGRKNLGSIRGVAMTAMVIGSALGPLPFGVAFDMFNGYKEILMVMLLFPVIATIFALLSPAPKLLRRV